MRCALPALMAVLIAGAAVVQEVDETGTGWVLTRLDLDVSVHPDISV